MWRSRSYFCFSSFVSFKLERVVLRLVMMGCRYRELWRFPLQQLIFFAAYAHWLRTHTLLTLAQASALLNGNTDSYLASAPSASTPSTASASSAAAAPASAAAASSAFVIDIEVRIRLFTTSLAIIQR
jgi:hypothetical protein